MNPNEIPQDRLEWLERLQLSYGAHSWSKEQEDAACVMEAVAYVAGEPHSDMPKCACPVLTRFCMRLNDQWAASGDGEKRVQQLKPYVVRLVGTRSTPEVERKRAFMAADWAVRDCLPWALEAPRSERWKKAIGNLPARLRALPQIVDEETARVGRDLAREMRDSAAADAAYAADADFAYADTAYAADAAYDAADDAAYAAADDAAADAAAAYAAADDAAAAFAAAAYAAAADYAKARASIDASVLALLDRMISVATYRKVDEHKAPKE